MRINVANPRTRTILIYMFTLAITICVIWILSQIFIAGSFSTLEHEQSMKDANVILNTTHEQSVFFITSVKTIAINDDTYKYMVEPSPKFIETNLNERKLQELQADFIVLLNKSGNLTYGTAFDRYLNTLLPLSDVIQAHITDPAFVAQISNFTNGEAGITYAADQPLLIATAPIMTKDAEGVNRGFVVLGRYVNEVYRQKLEEITSLPITLFQVSDPSLDPQVKTFTERNPMESSYLSLINGNRIAAYVFIPDMGGSTALIVKTERARDIFTIGTIAINYFIVSLLIVGLLLAVIGYTLLNRAFDQIDKNIEQFAILGDHIRNPLTVIVGLADLHESEISEKIIHQARIIDEIVTQLDRGWIESEKIKDFLQKYSKK